MTFKTPDVYIQEKSVLPPSVVTADTAVPAFIGYTDIAVDSDGNDLTNVPTRVRSMREYESLFGFAEKTEFNVTVNTQSTPPSYTVDSPGLNYQMYHSLQLFFANGGGDCYIVSVGSNGGTTAANTKTAVDIMAGIDKLKAEDGPTLIVPVDTVGLVTEPIAVDDDDELAEVLETAYGNYESVCDHVLAHCAALQDRFALIDVYQKSGGSKISSGDDANFRSNGIGINNLNYGAAYYPYLETTLRYRYSDSSVSLSGDLSGNLDVQTSDHYHNILSLLSRQTVTLPPSAAIAGVMATIDHSIGSWKAPANVSLNAVAGPSAKISNSEQADLNVDATAGKSINAIRTFNGKGTLVWGARTLAGNSNEWRYIPVRRLFIQMESDIKRATSYAVFEPNNAITWTKLRTQVESYLTKLWQDGGLAGATAAEAFFVRAGLGETMDEQDILEGRLNITVGAAAVRPAEFVVFTFTHKLQES